MKINFPSEKSPGFRYGKKKLLSALRVRLGNRARSGWNFITIRHTLRTCIRLHVLRVARVLRVRTRLPRQQHAYDLFVGEQRFSNEIRVEPRSRSRLSNHSASGRVAGTISGRWTKYVYIRRCSVPRKTRSFVRRVARYPANAENFITATDRFQLGAYETWERRTDKHTRSPWWR